MTSQEWLDGGNTPQKMVSLKPSDMMPLSEAPEEEQKAKKFVSYEEYRQTYKSDEQKKEELLSAMTNKMELHDTPLPQDLTEGCDDDEWDD
ncbi:hypothetical protein CAPTEDRAFT_153984 [Capitella teleta]|nr:hypothetical protein CAPTEDRAFT_153984 [Capitella teleta]|eukprot:ELU01699.1 hypothetical protein CAPTEDRAFT_153984 [Capitella teleta]